MPQPTHRHLPSTTAARQAASMQTRPPETRPRTSPHGSAVPCTTHSIAGVRNAPKATRPLAVTPEIASGPIAKNRLSPGAHQPSMVDSSTPLSQRAKCVRASVREFGSRYTGSHPGRLGAARRGAARDQPDDETTDGTDRRGSSRTGARSHRCIDNLGTGHRDRRAIYQQLGIVDVG